ncbi:MAG: hypothetical protein ACK58Z_09230, partial [Pseudanabaena sp.]
KSNKQRSPIHSHNHRSPLKKINQSAIAYPTTTKSDRLSKNKSNRDRLSILITSDRPSKKSTNQRSPIHPHNQRSPLKKSTKQRSPIQSLLTSDRHSKNQPNSDRLFNPS